MSDRGPGAQAQIFEAGFRPYLGPRLAPGRSFRTLWTYSVGRLLGRRRRFRSKLVPIASFFVAWIGAVVLIFIAALVSEVGELDFDTVREYYGQVGVGVVLFTVLATPMLLIADRRSGLLSLYLASPLTRSRYLNAQGSAILALLIAMSLVPVLILGIVYTLLGAGPGNAGDFVIFLLRTLAAAVSLALLPTTLGLAVCSVVRRAGLAIVVIALCLLVPSGITALLTEVAGAPSEINVLDLAGLPRALAKRCFALPLLNDIAGSSRPDDAGPPGSLDGVASWLVVLANLAWAGLLGSVAHWRYRRIEVER